LRFEFCTRLFEANLSFALATMKKFVEYLGGILPQTEKAKNKKAE
jgi:hypothetical protein